MTVPARYFLQPLSWHQTSGRPEIYQLRAIGDIIATLTMKGRRGRVTTADAEWQFEPTGIFRPAIDILVSGTDSLVGRFRPRWWDSGGRLEIPPDVTLVTRATRFDLSYSILTHDAQPIITHGLKGWASLRSPVTWGPAADQATRFPWLLPFAWYLAVRHYHDVMASTAVVVVG